jgi:hypothetical protein
MQSELLDLADVTPEAVKKVLMKEILVVITKSEDDLLKASGLQAEMPLSWDPIDPLARYRAVGIELEENGPGQ